MLVIQQITLSWNKDERGAKGENARRRFPLAYPVEDTACLGEVMVDRWDFLQEGEHFVDIRQKLRCPTKQHIFFYNSVTELNLTNLLLSPQEGHLAVIFFYDEQRSGRPLRRGHNRDYHKIDSPFYRKDILNETAFVLDSDQYGRVIWNEHMIDWDTGNWYYQLHIYHIAALSKQILSRDLFLKRQPDYEYRQLAAMY